MDCREVRAFEEEVSDQSNCVLVHPAFPRIIGRGKKVGGLLALGSCPVSDKPLPVVIGNGVNIATQRVKALNRGAVVGAGGRDSLEMVVNRLLRSTCVSPALVCPDHLVDPFMAEVEGFSQCRGTGSPCRIPPG
jgi:hypothetical protein